MFIKGFLSVGSALAVGVTCLAIYLGVVNHAFVQTSVTQQFIVSNADGHRIVCTKTTPTSSATHGHTAHARTHCQNAVDDQLVAPAR